MQKKHFFAILMLVIVGAPLFVFAAGLVPCGDQRDQTTGKILNMCTLCDIYVLAQNIMKFLMWQATPIIAIFALSWAGFKILISGPNPGLRSEGFGIMKKTLVGVLIVFSSWIIINEVLLFFAGETTATDPKNNNAKIGGILSNPWNAVNCSLPPAATVTAIAGFNNNPSLELNALIACVKTTVPSLRITSTTDTNIPASCNPTNHTTQIYRNPAQCQHTAYSCHYGGVNCASRGSFAFDFGLNQPTDPSFLTVANAAKKCQPGTYTLEEFNPNHGHISIGAINGCGCDM